MGKRWCVFSKRARVVGVSAATACMLACTLAGAAAPVPRASAGPTAEERLLQLPVIELQASPDPSAQLSVGDAVVLKVRGEGISASSKLALPEGASSSLDEQGWQLLSIQGAPPADGGFQVEAIPLKAGSPLALPLLVVLGEAGAPVARTQPLSFQVASAIKPGDPKPGESVAAKPPLGLAFPVWAAAFLGLAFAGILGFLIWALSRWLKKRGTFRMPAMPAGPPKTEDQAALEELDELERQGLVKLGQYKAHYFRVSEIAKRYLGKRYGFDAPESTASELIAALEAMGEGKKISSEWIDRTETLFGKLDRAKFTDHVPEPDEGATVLEEARKLVFSTRKPPPVVGPTVGPMAGKGGPGDAS